MRFKIAFLILASFMLLGTHHAGAEIRLRVGALAELSGAFSRLGSDCRKGYEAAIASNSSSIHPEVLFGDNEGIAKVGLSEFRRLVNARGAAIVITSRSPVGMAINPISKASKIPLIGIVGHPKFSAENPYSMRVFPSAQTEGHLLAEAALRQGLKKVVSVTLQDDYFVALTNSFETKFTEGGGEVTCKESVLPETQDFNGIVAKLRNCHSQGLVVNLAPAQAGNFLVRYRTADKESPIYSSFVIATPDVLDGAKELADEITYAEVDWNKPKFLRLLQSTSGANSSSAIGYACYSAMSLVLEGIKGCESTVECQRKVLSATKLKLLDEELSIENREVQMPIRIRKIEKGKITNGSF